VPEVSAAIAALPVKNVILDGELLWDRSAYHVFDLLWLDGRDLRDRPLAERLALLKALPLSPPLHHVRELPGDEPWAHAASKGWEGVVAKRRDSIYESRRSPHWLKMKVEANQELVVGGFTDPQGKRVGLGALLVGYYEGDDLVFAGKVGTSLPVAKLLELRARLDRLERKTTPFTRAVGLPRLGAHWVRPELVVQVAFMEWTRHGKLRHPRLVGERVDKQAREVVRE
jgi:bifunctional non-homologous end joining protein LigD